eukprot:scpid104756/ scgid33714/ 
MAATYVEMDESSVEQDNMSQITCEVQETDLTTNAEVSQSSQTDIRETEEDAHYSPVENTWQELPRPIAAPEKTEFEIALENMPVVVRVCECICERVSDRMYRSWLVFLFVCLAGAVAVMIWALVKRFS